jgi:hypothetical protein
MACGVVYSRLHDANNRGMHKVHCCGCIMADRHSFELMHTCWLILLLCCSDTPAQEHSTAQHRCQLLSGFLHCTASCRAGTEQQNVVLQAENPPELQHCLPLMAQHRELCCHNVSEGGLQLLLHLLHPQQSASCVQV